MSNTDYINRDAALQSDEILSAITIKYGEIDVVPVHYLKSLPVMTLPQEDDFFNHRIGDICIYGFHNKNKSCSIVEIVKILNGERGIAEIKFHNVFVDDSGNGYFTYLLKTGGTMNASFKYLKTIIPGKVEQC